MHVTFPLVPRRRVAGQLFGERLGLRRGHGTDVAGLRPYTRRDPMATIDWRASARLTTARGHDELVVRARYADEAPRVVLIRDRRPAMGIYGAVLPWLSKPAAVAEAIRCITASADAARSPVGYVDHADPDSPYWLPPRGGRAAGPLEQRSAAGGLDTGPADAVRRGLELLGRVRSALGSGTFVFVLSDFLGAPVPDADWLAATACGWEVVPVVIQDPVWEQSFPVLPPVTLPLLDPENGRLLRVRLSRRQAEARRSLHEQRLASLLASFGSVGLDPVVLGTSLPEEIIRHFVAWAAVRQARR